MGGAAERGNVSFRGRQGKPDVAGSEGKKQIVVERRTASPVVAEQAQGALPGGFIPEALSQASGLATQSFFLGDRSLEDLFGRIVVWHRCIRLETFLAPLVVRALLTLVSAAPAA
jgi:hypothetical protein